MKISMKQVLSSAAVAVAGLAFAAPAASAQTPTTTTYNATLNPLNHSTASGTATVTLSGNQATVTEHISGLAASFMGKPYPHVQHIHISGMGQCPTTAADTNGDGVVSTTEGAPAYGPIGTSLTLSGDTSPAAGTALTVAPSGASYTYQRTITLSAASMASITAGKGVIVVHGLDPATLSAKAQAEKSDLVPALPLAATSPALCGSLTASQMSQVPTGAPATGGGSTSGTQNGEVLLLGGGLVLAAGGTFALRKRISIR